MPIVLIILLFTVYLLNNFVLKGSFSLRLSKLLEISKMTSSKCQLSKPIYQTNQTKLTPKLLLDTI